MPNWFDINLCVTYMYVSLLSVTTSFTKDFSIEILKMYQEFRERKILIHFLEIINGGIENNVLTDTIRGNLSYF